MNRTQAKRRWLLAAALSTLAACRPAAEVPAEPETETPVPAPPVVEVIAYDFGFESPDAIAGGWVTLRMVNAGAQEHFLSVYRLPDGVSWGRFMDEAIGVFGAVWNAYEAGEASRAETWEALFTELPEWWFSELDFAGGPALTEPGETAETTVYLPPGTYNLECYVKTPEGTWHTELGMMRELTVTGPTAGAQPPAADVTLTLSNYAIGVAGELRAGTHTIAVHSAETPEGFARHDLNLFRLGEGETVEAIVAWMDWMDFAQFRAPAPAYSLGGMEQQSAGRTGYLTVTLEPGHYAWVSEEYGARGMVHEFTIE